MTALPSASAPDEPQRTAVREGLLCGALDRLEEVRLAGTRCETCGEVSLGAQTLCPNCGTGEVAPIALSREGTLWSYTVIRHCPPGDYRQRDSFAPFGSGLVELADGLRVLAPIGCPIDRLEIGMKLRFDPYVLQTETGERVLFRFIAAA